MVPALVTGPLFAPSVSAASGGGSRGGDDPVGSGAGGGDGGVSAAVAAASGGKGRALDRFKRGLGAMSATALFVVVFGVTPYSEAAPKRLIVQHVTSI